MDSKTQIIREVSTNSAILPLIVLAYSYIKKGKIAYYVKWIGMLVFLSFISEYISIYVGKLFGNNMPCFHAYVWLESSLLILFFYQISLYKKAILISGIAFLLFLILFTLIREDLFVFNTTGRIIQSILMLIFSLSYFYQIFKYEESLFIDKELVFWLVVGIFIYFCGAFFSFLLHQRILDKQEPSIWIYHNLANTLKHIIFGISLLLLGKE